MAFMVVMGYGWIPAGVAPSLSCGAMVFLMPALFFVKGKVGEFIGELNGMQSYDVNYNASRMDESLLSAFKNNPYTKSLTSVA